jgi:translation initiation factor 3 subunit B
VRTSRAKGRPRLQSVVELLAVAARLACMRWVRRWYIALTGLIMALSSCVKTSHMVREMAAPKDIESVKRDAAAQFEASWSWGEGRCIVVDNLPIVTDKAKIPKFLDVLSKVFAECGKSANGRIAHVDLPTNPETGATLGYAFIEFTHIESVKDAVKYGDGFVMGKSVIKVNAFTDIAKSMDTKDEYVEKPRAEFARPPDTHKWLQDARARPQFLAYYQDSSKSEEKLTELSWCESMGKPESILLKSFGGLFNHKWSPKGTYLACFHTAGLSLWSGEDWSKDDKHPESSMRVKRYEHAKVENAHFSPQEKYVCTVSQSEMKVWDLFHAEPKLVVPGPRKPSATGGVASGLFDLSNTFSFSHDDSFFLRKGCNFPDSKEYDSFEVYSVQKMLKLEPGATAAQQRAAIVGSQCEGIVPLRGIEMAKWSPKDNIIVTLENLPDCGARVSFYDVKPERAPLLVKSRQWQNVQNVRIDWSSNGMYLSALVDHVKGRPSKDTGRMPVVGHSIDLFRISEKDIPYETIKVDQLAAAVSEQPAAPLRRGAAPVEPATIPTPVVAFGWEPNGHRFAFGTDAHVASVTRQPGASGEEKRGTSEMDIFFYTMQNVRAGNISEVKFLKKLPGIKSNQLLWSPANGFMMIGLYGMQGSNGKFAIFNVNELEWIVPPDFVHAGGVGLQHWFFTDAEWDPTGRYLATFLTHTTKGSSNDNGYRLWSFSGKEIGLDKGKSFTPQKLFQFCWRPRPVSLLSKDQVKSIIRRLKEKPEEFEKFDREDMARLAFQERYCAAASIGSNIVLRSHTVSQLVALRSLCLA